MYDQIYIFNLDIYTHAVLIVGPLYLFDIKVKTDIKCSISSESHRSACYLDISLRNKTRQKYFQRYFNE